MKRKFINKSDFLIIGIVVILTIIFVYYDNNTSDDEDLNAIIIHNGNIIETLNMSNIEDCEFSLDDIPNIKFEIKDNQIRFIESDCSDKVCVNEGFISKNGDFAACLPNNVVISIENLVDNDVDVVIK